MREKDVVTSSRRLTTDMYPELRRILAIGWNQQQLFHLSYGLGYVAAVRTTNSLAVVHIYICVCVYTVGFVLT